MATRLIISIIVGQMLMAPVKLRAQSEPFTVHFDKPFYISGQTIWYKIYSTCLPPSDTLSEVVYLNIHDYSGRLLAQQKQRLSDGAALGDFPIPRQWEENYYYVTCFTSWSLRDRGGRCFTKKIAIYNVLEGQQPSSEPERPSKFTTSAENRYISLSKNTWTRGENIRVNLSGGQNGLASATMISLDEYIAGQDIGLFTQVSGHVYPVGPEYKKETELMFRAAVTKGEHGRPLESDLLLLYKTNSGEFRRVVSKGGQVDCPLGWFVGSAEYQLVNMNPFVPDPPFMEQLVPGRQLLLADSTPQKLPKTQAILRCINDEKLRMKIAELFNDSRPDFALHATPPTIPEADKVYKMERFKDLKTLEEFFREIVMAAELNTKNGQTTILLRNEDTKRNFMEKPWFLVDGKLTRDEAAVLALPFKNLVRVGLYNRTSTILGQLDPLMIRSGMVAVNTNGGSPFPLSVQTPEVFIIEGLSIKRSFDKTTPPESSNPHEHPSFRTPLYWNPSIVLTIEGSELVLSSPSETGEFILMVEGMTSSGEFWKDSVAIRIVPGQRMNTQ